MCFIKITETLGERLTDGQLSFIWFDLSFNLNLFKNIYFPMTYFLIFFIFSFFLPFFLIYSFRYKKSSFKPATFTYTEFTTANFDCRFPQFWGNVLFDTLWNFDLSLRKIQWFHLISWWLNFAERQHFRIVSGNLFETMQKLCLSTKCPHQKIRSNYSISSSASRCTI